MEILNVGYNNFVVKDKIIAIVSSDTKPIKRLISVYKNEAKIIDATSGRKTRTVIVMQSGYIVLSSIHPQTLSQRMHEKPVENV